MSGTLRRLLALALLATAGWAGAERVDDGPYVFHGATGAQAAWVCAGEVQRRSLRAGERLVAPCPSAAPAVDLAARHDTAPDQAPAPPFWAAVSDIHGQAGLFMGLLRAHGIVDAQDQWAWGRGALVIAGDIFDRGPTVTEALWQVYRLEQQARAAGGRVEFVLGNHETMVLAGDERYIHDKYRLVTKLLERSYAGLFAADTELGRWLRQRATVLKLGDTVFLHGGLHPELARGPIDLAAINAKFRQRLGASKAELAQDPEANFLYGRDGPIWYRGYFLPQRATRAEVDALLLRMDAKRMVVGHTTQREIRSLYAGRIIGVDAGLKYGDHGELLLWRQGKLWRGLPDGRVIELVAGEDDGSREQESL